MLKMKFNLVYNIAVEIKLLGQFEIEKIIKKLEKYVGIKI